MFELILENCEWGNLKIEVQYSEAGIESITVNGKQPKGREIEMINMSLREIEEEVTWRVYQNIKEVEYENRLFMGRV
jgi:3-deoxy-D-manno-octulosonic-acid transferase